MVNLSHTQLVKWSPRLFPQFSWHISISPKICTFSVKKFQKFNKIRRQFHKTKPVIPFTENIWIISTDMIISFELRLLCRSPWILYSLKNPNKPHFQRSGILIGYFSNIWTSMVLFYYRLKESDLSEKLSKIKFPF